MEDKGSLEKSIRSMCTLDVTAMPVTVQRFKVITAPPDFYLG